MKDLIVEFKAACKRRYIDFLMYKFYQLSILYKKNKLLGKSAVDECDNFIMMYIEDGNDLIDIKKKMFREDLKHLKLINDYVDRLIREEKSRQREIDLTEVINRLSQDD